MISVCLFAAAMMSLIGSQTFFAMDNHGKMTFSDFDLQERKFVMYLYIPDYAYDQKLRAVQLLHNWVLVCSSDKCDDVYAWLLLRQNLKSNSHGTLNCLQSMASKGNIRAGCALIKFFASEEEWGCVAEQLQLMPEEHLDQSDFISTSGVRRIIKFDLPDNLQGAGVITLAEKG